MGVFSSLSVKRGLSNSSTNMTNPIGLQECLRLCSQYDNWGGCKTPSPARNFRLVGPGMVLYQIYKASDGRHLRRGVVFYATGEEYKAHIFEWFDHGDGGCPSFSVRDELLHIEGDLFRTRKQFIAYEKENTSAVGELNWNTSTDEFAYREIYTKTKGSKAEVVDEIGIGDKSKPSLPSNNNEGVPEKKNPDNGASGEIEDAQMPIASRCSQSFKEAVKQTSERNSQGHRHFYLILCVLILDVIIGSALWVLKDELPSAFSDPFGLNTSKNERTETPNQEMTRPEVEQKLQYCTGNAQQKIYELRKREQEEWARREAEEKRSREQQRALQKQLKHKEIAEQQKRQMIAASQAAKEAGAKVCAVSEWNNGIAAWKLGDDMFKTKSYELAREHYSEAANHFKAAELTASKAEAKNLLASLPDLEVRAANLIRDNERWFKWSVDANALVSMGNELCKEYKKVELLVSKGVLANFGDTKSKLGNLILRCYELAADAGNTMAMLKLAYWSENGKICPKNSEKAVEWYVKAARAKNGDAMYRLGYFYSTGLMGLEESGEKAYLMFRSAKVNGCTFKNVDAWLNSLPNRKPHGYKVFLWGGMNVELDIDDLLDEIEARVK